MPTTKMPSDADLKQRYRAIEENERLDKIANWVLPNRSEPFDNQKDEGFLRALDTTAKSYHQLVKKTCDDIKAEHDS